MNAERMLKGFGGNQAIMQSTLIKQQQGHTLVLTKRMNLGDMVFDESKEGPFWINETECQLKWYDIVGHGKGYSQRMN
jgi:hypothetical protein